MSLLCDKYRPTTLAKCDFNQQQCQRMRRLISTGNFPHLLIYGPSGSGKKTRAYALLREVFGVGVERLKLEHKQFETSYGRKFDQTVMSSNYHLEVNPSDAQFFDRLVVQQLIKELATSASLTDKHKFKVVVITEADRLTREAQHALRRTLEKYVVTCRVILIAESASPIIPAVKSRCLLLRNGAPTSANISSVLVSVAKKECFSLSAQMADKIANDCDHNLRRALLMLETYNVRQTGLNTAGTHTTGLIDVPQPQWRQQLASLAKKLTESPSMKKVLEIRSAFYELQTHLVPNDLIVRQLTKDLLKRCLDDPMKSRLMQMAADCEHWMRLGSKPIIHLEAFAIKFMNLWKSSVDGLQLDDIDGDTDMMSIVY
ncbi:replication factor C subunit 3-like [Oppia nitens]|uniref:replication factor C subunit 3-like n=1 Tax=Oppia nitens TaxID=1686743 RepID=UPI0023DCDDEF|nr:replication factor C subunit 3-like [Oppia nitens]XP_054163460.1 replication factor C subunit 3-like [Oppia nitens]